MMKSEQFLYSERFFLSQKLKKSQLRGGKKFSEQCIDTLKKCVLNQQMVYDLLVMKCFLYLFFTFSEIRCSKNVAYKALYQLLVKQKSYLFILLFIPENYYL